MSKAENQSLIKVQEEENKKNEAFYLERCQNFDFCPKCEGYGEIFDDSDLEEPHKECDRCFGNGTYYI